MKNLFLVNWSSQLKTTKDHCKSNFRKKSFMIQTVTKLNTIQSCDPNVPRKIYLYGFKLTYPNFPIIIWKGLLHSRLDSNTLKTPLKQEQVDFWHFSNKFHIIVHKNKGFKISPQSCLQKKYFFHNDCSLEKVFFKIWLVYWMVLGMFWYSAISGN